MMPGYWERFKDWLCSTFGHSHYPDGTVLKGTYHQDWEFNGHKHRNCRRCRRIISTKL